MGALSVVVGVTILIYAVFVLAALWITGLLRGGRLDGMLNEAPAAFQMSKSYSEGPRGAVWFIVALGYAGAGVLVLSRSADAMWVFAAALAADIVLFLTWRDRRPYSAALSQAERWGEAALILMLGGALPTLSFLRATGELQ